ncbi:YkoF family thiamine/hydroxymethylpyrimidine-binding protein [Mesobacillus sp. AQ2]|uniref:YkoF family thiamine/hydroxymethylpyrimidine-binding protein n=1 Tax=Bacillaceae TaxID=186817 RepID=UPI0011A787D0|nr:MULTISPECIES: YkoF family thiamine/hydroxymethylpyrimidine-binding protein [Bacillaceae]MCM3121935.1 Ykof family thiamine-binding protein [Mesobacillus sp. MER 33]MCM3231899.1 Ykof family thiamine-binding protein [Mesobacillus sp. MER 48]WHX38863.1 YkoF family thiamine/hydroxymethylpyrimidine-binding protein [Mesobacillus sp. AQ2]
MEKNLCGTSEITGARFSIYPMSDRFVEIILSALKEVDTTKVWMKTDDISTCARGRSEHVFDVVKAIFLNASKGGDHVVLNATFSNGCPGDSAGDTLMAEDSILLNEKLSNSISQEVACQFALYPLGIANYMEVIMDQIKTVEEQGVFGGGVHYASRLDGDANQVFTGLEKAFDGARSSDSSHIVMTVTMSANSPSRKEAK